MSGKPLEALGFGTHCAFHPLCPLGSNGASHPLCPLEDLCANQCTLVELRVPALTFRSDCLPLFLDFWFWFSKPFPILRKSGNPTVQQNSATFRDRIPSKLLKQSLKHHTKLSRGHVPSELNNASINTSSSASETPTDQQLPLSLQTLLKPC